MKREDYIKKATARIFDSRQKRAVTAELEDHIAHRTQALEEIGYDPERAEAQGVEAMGDPAEICDQLGALHNRFYTPVWDIVFLLLWGGLLAGAYFALRQYVFGDVGLTALLNAGVCLVPGCACLYGVWCLHQNHPVTAVLYALGLGGSGVYLYFLLQKLSATMGGRFANWQAFLFHQEILKHQGLYANDRAVAGGIAGLLAPGVLLLLAAVIYMLKKGGAGQHPAGQPPGPGFWPVGRGAGRSVPGGHHRPWCQGTGGCARLCRGVQGGVCLFAPGDPGR